MALGRKPIEIVNEGKHQLLVKADHWDRIYLKEVAKVQNGYAFSSNYFTKSEGMPLIRIRDIDNYTTVDKYSGKYSEDFVVKKGDILVGMDGDFKTARWKGEDALLNQRVCRIIPNSKNYNEKFLVFCLQPFLNAINAETSSVTVKHISSKTIEEIPLPLPPKSEQDAIVSKIEELFSELDKGIEQLKTAQQQLKTFRQAVLKWAFVNDTFKHFILKEVTEKIQIGPFGTQLHKEDYIENGIPLINPTHIKGGFIVADTSFSISKSKRDSLPNYILEEGDVIMGRRGEMGRCGLVTRKEAGWFCGTGSLYFRPDIKKLNPVFLYYNLSSQSVKKYLDDNAGGTTMANLNLKIVNDIPISIPSIEEQNKIVQEIESRLSVADKMEEGITQSLEQAEALRQSILKKAFEGRLV